MTTLRTERLTLRPLELSDAARFSALSSDPGVARMTCGLPSPNPPIAAEGWILLRQARAGLGVEQTFAIDLAGHGLIGAMGVSRRSSDKRAGWEIGYWLGRPYWGKGLATEAGRALVAHLRAQGCTPLYASHFADNPASGRVLGKLGFTPTGALRPGFSLARREDAPLREVVLTEPRRAAA